MTVVGIICLLILLNGIFVLAEFAIISAPRTAIETRAKRGSVTAGLILRVIENPRLQDKYIGTAQIGITLASLGLGMYGEHAVATIIFNQLEAIGYGSWVGAHTLASIISVSFLTYLHIVFGEMIPKSLALQYSEGSAIIIGKPMRWIYLLLFPFVNLLNIISNSALSMMGIKREVSSVRYYTPDELELIVEKSQEVGLIEEDSGQVIKDLLKFGDLTAYSVMTPRVHVTGIPLNSTYNEIREIIKEESHTRYPVYKGDLDHIVGTVHIKDLLSLLINKESLTNSKLRPISFIPDSTPLDSVLKTMQQTRNQMAVVMDEHGGTAGIITIEDLFEEVVGEIEEDVNGEDVEDSASSLYIVEGTERLDEVGERLGLTLGHEEVETVSGLVLLLLGGPPKVGDTVIYEDLEFHVLEVEGHGVTQCQIKPVPRI